MTDHLIGWHEDYVARSIRRITEKEWQIASLQRKVNRLKDDANKHAVQIEVAKQHGLTRFSRECHITEKTMVDLNTDDRVRIIGTLNDTEGAKGSIVGWTSDDMSDDSYIILLDNPILDETAYGRPFNYKAVIIPEKCLQLLEGEIR